VEAGPLVPTFGIQSQGRKAIRQTRTADLDSGETGTGADADIWFQAKTATARYITPRNGAQIAKVGYSPVGVTGCQQAKLSTASIAVSSLPAGTYMCARTNKGQYSEFRVVSTVGPSPGVLNISYTTWKSMLTIPAVQRLKVFQKETGPVGVTAPSGLTQTAPSRPAPTSDSPALLLK
jgi:hypothetical protein